MLPQVRAVGQYCTAERNESLAVAITDSLARRFAPILAFSPGERYFPTIPFFPAFDDVDRPHKGPWQSSDSNRIAQLDSTRRIIWAALDRAYTRRVDLAPERRSRGDSLPIPHSTAVFFRTRCLDALASSRVWSFLQNDAQRWQRSGIRRLHDSGLRWARFQVLEYYMYYIRDTGLEGHAHDIEKLFVFIPTRAPPDSLRRLVREPGRMPYYEDIELPARKDNEYPDSLLSNLVIIAGAGHSTTTPNNVLVLLQRDAVRETNPYILVELGGHSVAPDYDGDGRFTPGLDINWHLNETIWGVRDLQAVSGTGYVGDYSLSMTLPRSPRTSIYLQRNPNDAFRARSVLVARAESTVAIAKLDTLVFRQEVDMDSLQSSRRAVRRGSAGEGYLLLPDSVLRVLHEASHLGEGDPDSLPIDDNRRSAVMRAVQHFQPGLDAWDFCGLDTSSEWCRSDTPSLPDSTVDFLVRRIARWAKPMIDQRGTQIKPKRWHVWENREYTEPAPSILKGHLYRPTLAAIRNQKDVFSLLGVGYDICFGPGGQQFQVAVVLPRFPEIMEVPGILEYQIGWYRRRFSNAAPDYSTVYIGLLYERHYKRLFSWYVKGGNVPNRATIERDPEASDFALGFGLSVMPLFPIAEKMGFFKALAEDLRIRTGFRLDTPGITPRVSRFELQVMQYFR